MTSEQLIKELIRHGESEQLDLQQSVRKDSIARTVCGFLNGEGGQILIGLSDNSEITGVKNARQISAELQQYLIEQIIPEAPVTVSVEPFAEKELLSVKVWGGSKKPYVFDGGIFYRRGASTVKASSREISELIQARQQTEIHWERQVALGVALEDLDEDEIKATIEASAKNSRAKEVRSDVLEFLSYYGLFSNGYFTNAAVVLFAKNPARFLPQCRVRVSYLQQGKTASTFKDDRVLEGNLFKNFDTIEDFFFKHLDLRRNFSDTKWQRQDDLQYPIVALREGLLNALVHRDYSSVSGSAAILIFPDKLEITNFGSLALKTADLKKSHLSLPVNPDIAQIVFLRGYIEKIGRGTLKIIDACKAAGLPSPVWATNSNSVNLTFFSDTMLKRTIDGVVDGTVDGTVGGTVGNTLGLGRGAVDNAKYGAVIGTALLGPLGMVVGAAVGAMAGRVTNEVKENLKELLLLIYKEEGQKSKDYAEMMQVSQRTIERYIKLLNDSNLIEFKGTSNQTGGYYLTNKIKKQLNRQQETNE